MGEKIISVNKRRLEWEQGTFSTLELTSSFTQFELIEEPEEIDIQGIKELEKANCPAIHRNEAFYIKDNRDKIGELIQAIKQLDRKINKKYCCNCGVELDKNNTALPNMCNECKYGEE